MPSPPRSGTLALIAALVLCGAAICLRLHFGGELVRFDTGTLHREALAAPLAWAGGHAIRQLALIAVTEGLLCGACWWALSSDSPRLGQRFFESLEWLSAPMVFGIAAWVRLVEFHNGLGVSDEFAYHFQSLIYRTGHLVATAPPYPAHFSCAQLAIVQRAWASQYPPGWPLLLSLPGLEWTIGPVLTALCVALLIRLTRLWYGREASQWCALLTLASAPLILNGATLFSHVATLFWTLLGLFCLSARPRKAWQSILAGACFGAIFATRYFDAVLLALAFLATRPQLRSMGVQETVEFLIPAALVGSLVLWQNAALTGNPWLGGYVVTGDSGRFFEESLVDKLKLLSVTVPRIVAWHPLLVGLGLAALPRRDRRVAFCLSVSMLFLIVYCRTGKAEIGARFHLLPCLLWLPILAGRLAGWAEPRRALVPALCILAFSWSTLLVPGAQNAAIYYRATAQWDTDLARLCPNGLVFLRESGPELGASWKLTHNLPVPGPQLRALFLDNTSNDQLRALLSGRPAVILDWHPNGSFEVTPYEAVRDREADLFYGAVNEYRSVLDTPSALRLLSGIHKDPWKTRAAALAEEIKVHPSGVR